LEEAGSGRDEFRAAGVETCLVALDLSTTIGTPPCSNDYVAGLRDKHDCVVQAWAAVEPAKGRAAIDEARHAVRNRKMMGFHFHPIMQHFSVDDTRYYPLFEEIVALNVPVMIDVGMTGMGAGTPGGMGAKTRHTRTLIDRRTGSRFSSLTIIMAHLGYPGSAGHRSGAAQGQCLEMSAGRRNICRPAVRDMRGRPRTNDVRQAIIRASLSAPVQGMGRA
jgi:predicted TIM-barrel fold metal-dependent hydrolase